MKRSTVILVMLSLMFGASATLLATIDVTGLSVIELFPPPTSVVHGALESNIEMIAFNEKQYWTLTQNVVVNISKSGFYDDRDDLTPRVIEMGTPVHSHFLHMDPVGTTWVTLDGQVTFQSRILGVILRTSELDASDVQLGSLSTMYPIGASRGLELDTQADWVSVSADRMTLRVHLQAACQIDQIRVLTEWFDPTIADLEARQRIDGSGLVDIGYSLSGFEPSYTVTLEYNVFGGPFTPATAVAGAVGEGLTPDATNCITWNPAVEPVPITSGTVRVRLSTFGISVTSGQFILAPGSMGSLAGAVHDPDGTPISGVAVVAAPGPSDVTDGNGEYAITPLPGGTTTVTFTKPLFHEVVRKTTISGQSTTVLNVVMVPIPIIQGPEIVEISSKFMGPDRHVYYIQGVPLREDYTVQIDWHESKYVPPYEVRWFVGAASEPVFTDRFLFPPPPEKLTHSFDVADFEVGEGLTVMAAAFVTGQTVDGRAIEWPSRRYRANFDVIKRVDATKNAKLTANTSGSTLNYDLPEDGLDMSGMDGGVDSVPSGPPLLSHFGLTFSAAGVVTKSIHGDGTIEFSFNTPTESFGKFAKLGPFEFKPFVKGSFSWGYLGEWRKIAATFGIGLTASATAYSPVWLAPPLYFGVSGGFDASIGIRIQAWLTELNADLAVTARIMPWIEGIFGAGVPILGNVESYVRGGVYFDLCLPSGEGACSAKPCRGILERIGIFEKIGIRCTWMNFVLYNNFLTITCDLCGDAPCESAESSREPGAPYVMSRDYLDKPYDVFVGNSRSAASQGPVVFGEREIVGNSFPYSIPSLTAMGNDLLMVYVTDNQLRSDENATMIVSRRYDGASDTWVDFTPAADDGTADYRPEVSAVSATSAWAAWENIKVELPAGSTSSAAKIKTEIMVGRYERNSEPPNDWRWVGVEARTANNRFDRTPRIAAADNGTAMLSWVGEEDLPAGLKRFSLHWSYFDGASWDGTPVAPNTFLTEFDEFEPIMDTALAFDGTQAILLFTKDPDIFSNSDSTTDNRELFGAVYNVGTGWTPIVQLTNDDEGTGPCEDASPQVAFDSNGDPVVVWYRCRNLYSATLTTTPLGLSNRREIVNLSGAVAAQGQFRLTTGPERTLALVWQSPSRDIPNIVHTVDDHGVAGEPVDSALDIWYALYEPTFDLWSHPLQLTSDGPMEHGMSLVLTPPLAPDPANPQGLPILTMVYNKVELKYGGTSAPITVGSGETPFTIENFLVPTFPGQDPNVFVQTDLYAFRHLISGDLSIDAEDIKVSPPNPRPGTSATVTAVVHNLGDLIAAGVVVTFDQCVNDIPFLAIGSDTILGPLVGGDKVEVSAVWNVPVSPGPVDICVRVTGGVAADSIPGNNTATITVLAPDLVVTDISAHSVGEDALLTIRVANIGVVPSAATDLRIHDGALDGPILDSPSVPELPAGAFTDLSYRWFNMPSGQNLIYAFVDEANSVFEFDEDNNTRLGAAQNYGGACCLPKPDPLGGPGGTCVPDQNAAQCSSQLGAWQGPGTVCTPEQCVAEPGACCRGDGTCEEVSGEPECDAQSGTFLGPGAPCDLCLNKACCLVSGGCSTVTPIDCGKIEGNSRFFADDCEADPNICPFNPPLLPPSPHDIRKNRFISINPNNPNISIAIKVELLDLACSVTDKKCNDTVDCKACDGGSFNAGDPCDKNSQCSGGSCVMSGETCEQQSPPLLLGWVGDPVEAGGDALPGTFTSAVVTTQPTPRTWPESVVHIGDCEIAPVRTYGMSATSDGFVFSDRLVVGTIQKPEDKDWGDLVGNFTGVFWTEPNFLVNVDDINAIIKFLTLKPAPHVTVCELLSATGPSYVNMDVNASELGQIIACFKGDLYPSLPMVLGGYPDLQAGDLLSDCTGN